MTGVISDLTELIRDMDMSFLNFISYIYIAAGFLVFLILVFGITAPYGRYSRKGWGFRMNPNLAWFVQETPCFFIPLFMAASNPPGLQKAPNLILFISFLVHYLHRTFIFPFLMTGGKPTTLTVFVIALMFCVANGYLHSAFLLYHADFGQDWWSRPHIWIGLLVFFSGMATNIHSDHILRNLRKPGETGYKIPRGGLFEFVSGANFFGEMLEWTGFAVATWSLPGLAFAIWTWTNLGPRAWQHHKFYLQKFEDYPKTRKAVIPFIL